VRRWLFALVFCACTKGHGELSLVEVKRADLVIGVEVSGELAAVDSTDIRPPALPNVWNYKVASLAPEGIDVKQGDPVAGFDPSEIMRELETLRNDADAAKKKLDKKKDDAALARRDEELAIAEAEAGLRKASLKTTMPEDLVASVEAKVVALDVQLAQMHVEQAKAKAAAAKRSDAAEVAKLADHHAYLEGRVKELQANIMKMQVPAPRAGTVVYPADWRGEKKKVGDQAWRGEGVIQIVGLGKMVGNGEVDEIDIARIAVGQAVAVRLDALPDVKVAGTVESIAKAVAPKSRVDRSNIVKIKIEIDAGNDVPLRPGMRFRGQVDTEKLASVIQIPADAVFVTPEGPVAYKADGDDITKVKLQVG
jgi:multidrug resistance efflux pump